MRLHSLSQSHSRKAGRRVGRGISAGQGKTAGRGTKGQKARTGANSNIPRTFEGGATGMIQRLPKLKGFKSHRNKPETVNLAKLASVFETNTEITLTLLAEKGLVTSYGLKHGVKIVGASVKPSKTFTYSTEDARLKVSNSLQPSKSE